MISLVMLPLNRAAVEPEADLVASVDLAARIWEIFLEIFLEIYSVAVDAEDRIMVQ